ncbi:hypothetical protein IC218_04645 [Clostridioides sp. ES-S-0005-03]|uniref:hypothetical protein n=1 Tax=Clostridioides sp. ES-S-0005-03 TaxID=2770774 RepID=UPI001D0FF90E|nr:hypothetical protein [Clostridioides sp. ES-S-0005-03]
MSIDIDKLKEDLKIILKEESSQFFSEKEIDFYLEQNSYNLRATAYTMLLLKAEDDSLALTGLNIPSNQNYWLRLAKKYKPNTSGVL